MLRGHAMEERWHGLTAPFMSFVLPLGERRKKAPPKGDSGELGFVPTESCVLADCMCHATFVTPRKEVLVTYTHAAGILRGTSFGSDTLPSSLFSPASQETTFLQASLSAASKMGPCPTCVGPLSRKHDRSRTWFGCIAQVGLCAISGSRLCRCPGP